MFMYTSLHLASLNFRNGLNPVRLLKCTSTDPFTRPKATSPLNSDPGVFIVSNTVHFILGYSLVKCCVM